jgi:hypothetical protein
MATATWELDRTDLRHPTAGRASRPAPRAVPPARRPAPARSAASRAATRTSGVPARIRRRLAGLALLVIVCAAFVVAGRADAAAGGAATGATAEVLAVVVEGETVWDVALPAVPAGEDPLVYVSEVVRRNGLHSTAVAPGTVVRLH